MPLVQDECYRLVKATKDGDMEVVTSLIDDVDMNSVIYEVCSTQLDIFIQLAIDKT